MESNKLILYQVFTRLYGNRNTTRKENGTIAENGCGKMNDFTPSTLKKIREMGVSHIWYTGVIRHASQTDYSANGIPCQHPADDSPGGPPGAEDQIPGVVDDRRPAGHSPEPGDDGTAAVCRAGVPEGSAEGKRLPDHVDQEDFILAEVFHAPALPASDRPVTYHKKIPITWYFSNMNITSFL